MKVDAAKKLAKDLNVKGFRAMRLARGGYVVGRQTKFLNPEVANKLIDGMLALGFEVMMLQVCRQLANKGLLDSISIR